VASFCLPAASAAGRRRRGHRSDWDSVSGSLIIPPAPAADAWLRAACRPIISRAGMPSGSSPSESSCRRLDAWLGRHRHPCLRRRRPGCASLDRLPCVGKFDFSPPALMKLSIAQDLCGHPPACGDAPSRWRRRPVNCRFFGSACNLSRRQRGGGRPVMHLDWIKSGQVSQAACADRSRAVHIVFLLAWRGFLRSTRGVGSRPLCM